AQSPGQPQTAAHFGSRRPALDRSDLGRLSRGAGGAAARGIHPAPYYLPARVSAAVARQGLCDTIGPGAVAAPGESADGTDAAPGDIGGAPGAVHCSQRGRKPVFSGRIDPGCGSARKRSGALGSARYDSGGTGGAPRSVTGGREAPAAGGGGHRLRSARDAPPGGDGATWGRYAEPPHGSADSAGPV